MKILGIDPGTSACAFAILDDGVVLSTQTLRPSPGNSQVIFETFEKLIQNFKVEMIVCEDFRHWGTPIKSSPGKLESLIAELSFIAACNKIPFCLQASIELRRTFTDEDLCLILKQQHIKKRVSHHARDAIGHALVFESKLKLKSAEEKDET